MANHIELEGRRYTVRDGETVLEALCRGGANVRFSCRKGTCRACLLQVAHGPLPDGAQRSLPEEQRELGWFMPCITRPRTSLQLTRPDLSRCHTPALLAEKSEIAPGVFRLLLEPLSTLAFRAGQYVNLHGPSGAIRSYSIASIAEEDYFLELHIRHWPGGSVSEWVARELQPGQQVTLQGPLGTCFYDPAMQGRPLLLLGTGTGLAPLWGLARDALRSGHVGGIRLFHGARLPSGLYLDESLRTLARKHPSFSYFPSVTRQAPPPGVARGRVTELALPPGSELEGAILFACGNPEMVQEARTRAALAGVRREDVFADAFEDSALHRPRDAEKIAAQPADPELWKALEGGPGLTRILEDFYTRAFEDPRIAPFFHRITRERAIQKQYEFLSDLISGSRQYFGLRPFNAHHWMVISDELFDYREQLMLECLRRYGLAEPLIRRWSALHEQFRRDIVKAVPRGLVVAGREEALLEGYQEETLAVGALCDGCSREMAPGSVGRMHQRTGELYCQACVARRLESLLPGAEPAPGSPAG